jgi:hypothetical protein
VTYILLYLELRLWARREWLKHERRHERANHRWGRAFRWSNQMRVSDLGIVAWPDTIRHTAPELAGSEA